MRNYPTKRPHGALTHGMLLAFTVFGMAAGFSAVPVQADYSVTESWWLEDDLVVNGDFYLKDGDLVLNEHSIQINGNLIQTGGFLDIQSGQLVVTGDYIQSGEDGSVSHGEFHSTSADGRFEVDGNVFLNTDRGNGDYLYDGTLVIGGDLTVMHPAELERSALDSAGGFAIEFKGPDMHTVYFENSEMDRMNKVRITDGGSVLLSGETAGFYADSDLLLAGGSRITGTNAVEFCGYTVEVLGDFIQDGPVDLLMGESHLIVDGDYIQRDGFLDVQGGQIEVKGSFLQTGEDGAVSHGEFHSTWPEGRFDVDGDVLLNTDRGNGDYLYDGTLVIGGDLTVMHPAELERSALDAAGGFVIEFKGPEDHIVYFENSERDRMNKVRITDGGAIRLEGNCCGFEAVSDLNLVGGSRMTGTESLYLSGYTMEVQGDFLQDGPFTIYPNESSLIIDGDLIQTQGLLDIQGGNVQINGNYLCTGPENQPGTGRFHSTYPEGRLTVGGDVVIRSTEQVDYQYDGLLQIGGGLCVYAPENADGKAFNPGGGFKVVFGEGKDHSLYFEDDAAPMSYLQCESGSSMDFTQTDQWVAAEIPENIETAETGIEIEESDIEIEENDIEFEENDIEFEENDIEFEENDIEIEETDIEEIPASEEQISLADYMWFTEDVMWNGIPDDMEDIEYFDEIVGSWKAVIIANPTTDNYDGTMTFLTAAIGGSLNECEVNCDWKRVYIGTDGRSYEDDRSDSMFHGSASENGITVIGSGKLEMVYFYRQNGTDYIVGYFTWPDGQEDLIGMSRRTPTFSENDSFSPTPEEASWEDQEPLTVDESDTDLDLVSDSLQEAQEMPDFELPVTTANIEVLEEITPSGNSRAFSVQPVPGMTISAPENAMDYNRPIAVTEIEHTSEIFRRLDQYMEAQDTFLMEAWHYDAELESNEHLPGKVKIELDLREMGIDEEYYDAARLYRIDNEGTVFMYNSVIDGDTLIAETDQNSLLSLGIFGIAGIIAGRVRYVNERASDIYMEENGAMRRVGKTGALSYYIEWVPDDSTAAVYNEMKQIMEEDLRAHPRNMNQSSKEELEARMERLKKNERFKTCAKALTETPGIDDVETIIAKAVSYLMKEQKVHAYRFPQYAVGFYLRPMDDGTKGEARQGEASTDLMFGNPFITLSNRFLKAKYGEPAYNNEKGNLLLTTVHELFHIIQKEYKSDNIKYDEATAVLLENEALAYFKADGAIAQDASLDMCPNNYYENLSIPMDLGSGGWTYSDTRIMQEGYTLYHFIDYLRTKLGVKDTVKVHHLKLAGISSDRENNFTGALMRVLHLSEDEMSRYYIAFCKEKKNDFAFRYNEVNVPVGTPEGYIPEIKLEKNHIERITVKNRDYATTIRQFASYDRGKEYMVLFKGNPDFELIPVKTYPSLMADKIYEVKDGYLFAPIKKSNGQYRPAMVLEAHDQLTAEEASNSESYYDTMALYALDKPNISIEEGYLCVSFPEASEAMRAEYLDGFRLTIQLPDGTTVRRHYKPSAAGKVKKYKLSTMLSEEAESNSFKVSICEFVKTSNNAIVYCPESEAQTEDAQMDELLEQAGALSGDITVSMMWHTHDDMDLHLETPEGELYYNNKETAHGKLDVDQQVHESNCVANPVENIYVNNPPEGHYKVRVVNYTDRTEESDTPVRVRVTINGVAKSYDIVVNYSETVTEFDIGAVEETEEDDPDEFQF